MNRIVEEVEADVRSLDIGVVWSRPFLVTIVFVEEKHSVVEDEHWRSWEVVSLHFVVNGNVVNLVWEKRLRVR